MAFGGKERKYMENKVMFERNKSADQNTKRNCKQDCNRKMPLQGLNLPNFKLSHNQNPQLFPALCSHSKVQEKALQGGKDRNL